MNALNLWRLAHCRTHRWLFCHAADWRQAEHAPGKLLLEDVTALIYGGNLNGRLELTPASNPSW